MNPDENSFSDSKSTKEAYDVDVISALKDLKNEIFNNELNIDLSPQEYYDRIEGSVRFYCRKYQLDFDSLYNLNSFLVVPSDKGFYSTALALTAMSFDPVRIPNLFDYQKYHYQGPEDFKNLIEFEVYGLVKSFSKWDNMQRLAMIFQWVYLERGMTNAISFPLKNEVSRTKPVKKTKNQKDFSEFFTNQNYVKLIVEYLLDRKIIDAAHNWVGRVEFIGDFVGLMKALNHLQIIRGKKFATVCDSFKHWLSVDISRDYYYKDRYKIDDGFNFYIEDIQKWFDEHKMPLTPKAYTE